MIATANRQHLHMTTSAIPAHGPRSNTSLNPVAPRTSYIRVPPGNELPANVLFAVTFGDRPPIASQRAVRVNLEMLSGADLVEVTAMLAAPLPAIRPQGQQPAFQSARGISTATNWKGEVISLDALVNAVAAGKASSSLVMANEVAITRLARATRGTLQVPGIRFFSQATVRAGRR